MPPGPRAALCPGFPSSLGHDGGMPTTPFRMITRSSISGTRLTLGLGMLGWLAVANLGIAMPSKAGMVEDMISSKCAEAMVNDFKKANQTPPPGMVKSTCDCVLNRFKQKLGLDTAIKTCSADATKQYGLSSAAPAK